MQTLFVRVLFRHFMRKLCTVPGKFPILHSALHFEIGLYRDGHDPGQSCLAFHQKSKQRSPGPVGMIRSVSHASSKMWPNHLWRNRTNGVRCYSNYVLFHRDDYILFIACRLCGIKLKPLWYVLALIHHRIGACTCPASSASHVPEGPNPPGTPFPYCCNTCTNGSILPKTKK